MPDHGSWSVRVGRIAGVELRLHMFFLLFASATLLYGWQVSRQPGMRDLGKVAAVSVLVLLGSGILHEFSHVLAARRLGGRADRIVLGPLVGLTSPTELPNPRAEAFCYLAGPLMNGFVCIVCLVLIQPTETAVIRGLLHPLAPTGVADGLGFSPLLRLAFWINWVMLLVNLLPVFPFDGGGLLRVFIYAISRGRESRPMAAFIASGVARIFAGLLAIAALIYSRVPDTHPVPIWFVLLMLAILVFFSARHEGRLATTAVIEEALSETPHPAADDADSEFDPPTRPVASSGSFAQWREQKRLQRLERQRAQEAYEERRVDEILIRLHAEGMESLSDDDRAVLDRVSARYRDRQQHPR